MRGMLSAGQWDVRFVGWCAAFGKCLKQASLRPLPHAMAPMEAPVAHLKLNNRILDG